MRSTPNVLHEATDNHSREVRAIVLPLSKSVDGNGESKADDPWERLTVSGKVVRPPFDLFALATFPEYNSELNQCIEAMEVNISGFGYKLVAHQSIKEPTLSDPDTEIDVPRNVALEYQKIKEFLDYGSIDGTGCTDVRRRLRRDLESTGNAYLELITDTEGNVVGYNPIPSYQMRLSVTDKHHTMYEENRLLSDGSEYTSRAVKRRKRFRRYVQQHRYSKGYKQVWFKELGDPRDIDCNTGEPMSPEQSAENPHMKANPMVHMRIYSPRTPYGVPRYVGNLLSILGGRASEEINYTTFKNNNMPSMLLMVSNGVLTQGTIDRISSFTETMIQGSDNYSKFLIIEADPDSEDGGQVKIEAKPLVQNQHNDALFQEYDKNTTDKIRRAFRIPPILVGRSDDYTRATAETSKRIGDEQVFAPERSQEDQLWNRVLRHMGMKYHSFKSNSPNVTDDKDIINVMKEGERSGAMTPRIARRMVEDILGTRLPDMSTKVELDVPFSLQMAEAVKNQAKPNEVSQQVTALKEFYKSATEAPEDNPSIPAIYVPAVDLAYILSKNMEEINISGDNVRENVAYAMIDDKECWAIVELEKSEGETHRITRLLPIEPIKYGGWTPLDPFSACSVEGVILE